MVFFLSFFLFTKSRCSLFKEKRNREAKTGKKGRHQLKARRRKKREKERGRKGKKGRREGREEGKKVASPKFPTPRHNHNYILGYILPVFLLLYIVFCAPLLAKQYPV